VVIDVACNNGDFTNIEPSFAEAWTRAGTPDAPMGALATYSSTIAAAWDEPAEMSEGITDAFLNGRHAYWGEAIFNGLLHMEAFFGETYTTTETKFTFMNFGDPSMRLRSMEPIAIEASYDRFVNEQGFDVVVVDASGSPVPDATVAISTDEGLLDAQLTNEDGQVSFLMLEGTAAEPFTLVVTGFDLTSIVEDVSLVNRPEGNNVFGSQFAAGYENEDGNGNGDGSGNGDETPGQTPEGSSSPGEAWSAGGCSTTGAVGPGPGGAALWVMLGGLLLGSRRRRA
jgi:MYXO-CTERM domain-containing protein